MPAKRIYNYCELDKEIKRILDEGDSWDIDYLSTKYKIPKSSIYQERNKLGFMSKSIKHFMAYTEKEKKIISKNLEFKNSTIVKKLAKEGFKRTENSIRLYKNRNRLTRYGNELSIEEVAEGLGVSTETIRRYISKGQLKIKKIESASGSNPFSIKITYPNLRDFIIKYCSSLDLRKILSIDWFIDVVADRGRGSYRERGSYKRGDSSGAIVTPIGNP